VNSARYRLVAFDLDGTLLQGPDYVWSWKLVWRHLGYQDSVRAGLMNKYLEDYRQQTNKNWYQDWCDEAAKLFIKKGLKRDDFKAITKDLAVVEGFHETLRTLKGEGLKVAIISGGIDVFLDEKIPDYQELFDYYYMNRFIFDKAGLFTGVDATQYDF